MVEPKTNVTHTIREVSTVLRCTFTRKMNEKPLQHTLYSQVASACLKWGIRQNSFSFIVITCEADLPD